MKKILIYSLLVLFFVIVVPSGFVNASAQCTGYDNNSPATVTISESRTVNFGNYSSCLMFCQGSCSSAGICTYTLTTSSTYSNCAAYCASGYAPASGGYCIPSGAVSCGGSYNCSSIDIGGGYCQDSCQCTNTTVTGNVSNISGSCVNSQCNCSNNPTGTSCQFSSSGGSATFPPYTCAVGGNPPSGVDVKATVWTDANRNVVFANQSNSDGPVWVSSQYPYKISWGAVSGADSCTLNGSTVSTAGGSINTFTFPYAGPTSLTYTLSCTGAGGTATDSVVVKVPPPPTNATASCPAPGTSGTMSWTPPSGYNSFYTRVYDNTSSAYLLSGTQNGIPGSSLNFNGTTVGDNYGWWMHTGYTLPAGIALSDPPGGNFTCSSCVNANYQSSGTGFSTGTTGPTGTTITVNAGSTFYAYVGYTNGADAIILPNVSGSYSCSWVSGVMFRCTAPSTNGTYTYTSGIQNYPSPGSNRCAETVTLGNVTVIGGVTPIISSFTANPTSGTAPLTTTLTWSSTNTTSCSISGGWAGTNLPTSGSQVVSGISSNTSFTLVCTNGSTNTAPSTVNVTVNLPSYSLRVNSTVGGYVTGNVNPRINCGSVCNQSYVQGTTVVLTATPISSNWKFVGWRGDCSGTRLNCSITVNGNKNVNAIFAPRSFIYEEF